MEWLYFESIDSTNDYLKNHAHTLQHQTVCVAKTQSHGHGRLGRTWVDDGNSCLFSVLYKEALNVSLIGFSPLLAAYALHQTLISIIDEVTIKWPNDLLVRGRKIAGILTESIIEGDQVIALIIGIGINTNTKTIPESLRNIATSYWIETQKRLDHQRLMETILDNLEKAIFRYEQQPKDIVDYLNKYTLLKHHVQFNHQGIIKEGYSKRILEDGSLEIATEEGTLAVKSGEIILIKKEGPEND